MINCDWVVLGGLLFILCVVVSDVLFVVCWEIEFKVEFFWMYWVFLGVLKRL